MISSVFKLFVFSVEANLINIKMKKIIFDMFYLY